MESDQKQSSLSASECEQRRFKQVFGYIVVE